MDFDYGDEDVYDAAIIGGGAAGMAAAIAYMRRPSPGRLLLAEANDICGKKLLATGNGRCNISNLSAEGYLKIKAFFESIGVLLRAEDGGRVYPMSGKAASVRDAMARALERGHAEVKCGARVTRVVKAGDGSFILSFRDGSHAKTEKLLIATGGKAGPQYGCQGDGYTFARNLGHNVGTIRPALVPLVYTERETVRLGGLAGVRIESQAELIVDSKTAASSSGMLQFTSYGLSGIMIFDISSMMPKSVSEGNPYAHVLLDFAPGEEAETLERLMLDNKGFWLEGVIGKSLSALLVKEGEGNVSRIAELAKGFKVSVCGTKGWKEAQTTQGGVSVSEIDEGTGESLLCKGLFFAGEVLEPVFICGGFNLNHAWLTGLRAGENL